MKECDILEGQNILWPLLYIFRWVQPEVSQDLRPGLVTMAKRSFWHCGMGWESCKDCNF